MAGTHASTTDPGPVLLLAFAAGLAAAFVIHLLLHNLRRVLETANLPSALTLEFDHLVECTKRPQLALAPLQRQLSIRCFCTSSKAFQPARASGGILDQSPLHILKQPSASSHPAHPSIEGPGQALLCIEYKGKVVTDVHDALVSIVSQPSSAWSADDSVYVRSLAQALDLMPERGNEGDWTAAVQHLNMVSLALSDEAELKAIQTRLEDATTRWRRACTSAQASKVCFMHRAVSD